ncbi:MAG: PilZ domain-containing protein [Desulfobacterales bacterium]
MTLTELSSNNALCKIFSIVETMEPEGQLDLLSRLGAEKLPSILYQLIVDLPEFKRADLLNDLNERVMGKRSHQRKKVTMATDYVIDKRAYRSFITDISESGVFIQNPGPLKVGDNIVQNLSLSDRQIPFKFNGEVVRVGKDGVGVKFRNLSQYQRDVLRSIFETL